MFGSLRQGLAVSPCLAETLYVDQAGFELQRSTRLQLSPSAGVKGMHHYTKTVDKNWKYSVYPNEVFLLHIAREFFYPISLSEYKSQGGGKDLG